MTLLDSHPWLHHALIFVFGLIFFGISLIDAFLQASYGVELGKATKGMDIEQKMRAMQSSRAVLGFIFLISGFSLFSLVIHSPAGK